MFTEREAILMEMQELKEQGRLDYDMYFELRKFRNERYNQLQDRLRIIDDRDKLEKPQYVPRSSEPPKMTPLSPSVDVGKTFVQNNEHELQTLFKTLPVPKVRDIQPSELKYDRIRKEEEKKIHQSQKYRGKVFPTPIETTEAIERYLKHIGYAVRTKQIKQAMERQFDIEWTNFSNVLERAVELSPYIHVNKTKPRQYTYQYQSIKR